MFNNLCFVAAVFFFALGFLRAGKFFFLLAVGDKHERKTVIFMKNETIEDWVQEEEPKMVEMSVVFEDKDALDGLGAHAKLNDIALGKSRLSIN